MKIQLILGDCLIKLKEIPENSVDSIVTDPPYELGFMGKAWDNTGIANNVKMWKECLRVLKPGGHLLSFGGTRTYHKMACAIEDAGFEVRDMIEWVYGSGFPKSLNIGKAVDKLQGTYIPGEISPNSRNSGESPSGCYSVGVQTKRLPNPQSDEAKQWEGWGTALKPAHEPICMARKPLAEKTVAENCLKWGTGGINIDVSRVETVEEITNHSRSAESAVSKGKYGDSSAQETHQTQGQQLGRFPANLIHDGSEEVTECFPETKTGAVKTTVDNGANQPINLGGGLTKERLADSGNASRFFKSIIYTAKASKSERNKGCEDMPLRHYLKENKMGGEGDTMLTGSGNPRDSRKHNNHPTVKPIALMEYLIKMVTPKGGTVLDPFMGSGSTGVACKKLGRNFIGVELNQAYCEIAKKRIEDAPLPLL